MVWICNICGTKNTDDKASCVACAAAKGTPAPTAIAKNIFNVIAELTPKPPKAAGVVVIPKAAAGAHDDGDEKGDDADRREAERKAREEAKRKADKAKADAERKAREEAERKAREEAKRKADAQGQGGIPKIKLVPIPGDAVVGAAADRKALDAKADAEHKAHVGNIAQNVAMADVIAAEVKRQVDKANADKAKADAIAAEVKRQVKANADKANADKAKAEDRKRVKKELEQERRYRSIGQIIIALIVGVIGTLLVTKGFKFAADVKHDYHKILNNLEGIINTSDIIRLRKMLNQINNPKVDEEIKQYEMELKTRYPNRPHVTPLQADMLLEKIQHLTSHQIAMLVNPPQTQKVLPKDVMNNINNINNIPVFAMGKKRKVKKNLKKSIRRPRR
jgi:Skp family chaperone for outer membrane proteins